MISVCIIMKNEEGCIEECLKRAASLGWEIVVVDTGSQDKSKALAAKYTDKVYDFKWINDFSAARNFAAEKATNDIIFALDCDELIEFADCSKLENDISDNKNAVFCPLIINIFERDGLEYRENGKISRIYSKSFYNFSGKIHEQLVRLDGKPSKHIDAPVSILHTGYNGTVEERIKKAQRNIDLLLTELKEKPDDPYIHFQLGKAYFMQKKTEQAVKSFESFLDLKPDLRYEYVEDGIESLCYCLINTKQYKKALEIFNKYDGKFNNIADFEFLGGHIFMNNGMFSEAAMRFLNAAQCSRYRVEGTNSYSAFYNIGIIFECCGQKETAAEYYERCGNYAPAAEGLKRLNK